MVNCPFYFPGIWSGIKPLLPADTAAAARICGRNDHLRALAEFVDADQIPQEYGGASPFALHAHP